LPGVFVDRADSPKAPMLGMIGRRRKIRATRPVMRRKFMSITTPKPSVPLGELQSAERGERLEHLARMVFELMAGRLQGGTSHEFDGSEDAALIAALRACSFYITQIGCLDFGDSLVVRIEGIDGHDYILRFSPLEPRFPVHVARVLVAKSPIVGRDGRVDRTYQRMNVLEEHSKRLKLGKLSTDQAFLVGMSLVIAFMDDQGDDPDEDARLAPLTNLVMPTEEELREIWARKLPPSTINYDDEGDQPF
jgi:hypothetical protein